ncbi:hypothetical protein THAOC_24004, partial [Thalassiosira oceanica]
EAARADHEGGPRRARVAQRHVAQDAARVERHDDVGRRGPRVPRDVEGRRVPRLVPDVADPPPPGPHRAVPSRRPRDVHDEDLHVVLPERLGEEVRQESPTAADVHHAQPPPAPVGVRLDRAGDLLDHPPELRPLGPLPPRRPRRAVGRRPGLPAPRAEDRVGQLALRRSEPVQRLVPPQDASRGGGGGARAVTLTARHGDSGNRRRPLVWRRHGVDDAAGQARGEGRGRNVAASPDNELIMASEPACPDDYIDIDATGLPLLRTSRPTTCEPHETGVGTNVDDTAAPLVQDSTRPCP